MMTNQEYSDKVGLAHRKKYAQFFTPETISDFMVQWILGGIADHKCAHILDPAFGLGVFSHSLVKSGKNVKITGFDIDDEILNVAQMNFAPFKDEISIYKQDYLTSSWEDKYDGIVCNPPYLKFHDYDNVRYIPEVNSRLGTRLNGFANIYTLFLLKSISQLKECGRLAYIIPTEFLNSDYGVEVKRALISSGTLRHVIIVDFTECAFDDALTTASILLCEKKGKMEEVRFSTIKDISELDNCLKTYKAIKACELDEHVKWKQYYEDTHASKFQNLVPFSKFAKVSRGIATGANDYFTLNQSKMTAFGIQESCALPCICHAQDVKNSIFTSNDFFALAEKDKSVYLFNGCADKKAPSTKKYLETGIELGIDKRYLTANRSPWYAIENRMPSPIWVSVFNRNGLRFVRNEAGVYNLTTFHCVYDRGVVETDVLFSYLMTTVAKQIFLDNSRQYGNGLIKFEPNDLNKGMVVDLSLLTESETMYVKSIYAFIKAFNEKSEMLIEKLDSFFLTKYTGIEYDIKNLIKELEELLEVTFGYRTVECIKGEKEPVKKKIQRTRQLDLFDTFRQYP